ncbi:MAG: hypothetical protein ACKVPY_09760 [Paracoccaceae bacterium]
MSGDDRVDFEGFLVEDVILTLGNVRLSLSWLASGPEADASGASGDWRRAGIDRLDRQLGHLEDRARALRETLKARRRAGGDGSAMPVFRSRRTLLLTRRIA